jgi:hypothetical protein
MGWIWFPRSLKTSVPDPDPNPDPPDPHVVGPSGSGSGSTSQRYGSGSGFGSGSFYHHAKIVRKTLIPTILWLFLTFSLWSGSGIHTKMSWIRNTAKNLFPDSSRILSQWAKKNSIPDLQQWVPKKELDLVWKILINANSSVWPNLHA